MPLLHPVTAPSWLCQVTNPQAAKITPNAEHRERAKQQREIDRRKIPLLDGTPNQLRPVIAEHLQESLAPAQTLTPALREGNGLLVIQDGAAAIPDAIAVQHRIHGEFEILGK